MGGWIIMQKHKYMIWDTFNEQMNGPYVLPDDLYGFNSHKLGIELDGAIWLPYTGRKDNQDIEVYKGDILIDDNGNLLEVKFGKLPLNKAGDCVCHYEAFYCKNYGQLGMAPFYECEDIGEWMKKIGTIYENPELLNKGEKHGE
jgi:hypothetical protein